MQGVSGSNPLGSISIVGWFYLIRNVELHKISRNKNIQLRIKELKLDEVIEKLKTSNYEKFERQLQKQCKDVESLKQNIFV